MKKSIIRLTKEELEHIQQIHHTRMGLLDMIGTIDMRKEKFVKRIGKKHGLEVGMFSINTETGIIIKT